MREVSIRLRFRKESIGNVKSGDRFHMPRDRDGDVIFLSSWHLANMRLASKLANMHRKSVNQILWDLKVEGATDDEWVRRYLPPDNRRFSLHEAFMPGKEIVLHCAVPTSIDDLELLKLMDLAGQYKGLSPWSPGKYGFYQTVEIAKRRRSHEVSEPGGDINAKDPVRYELTGS